MSTTRNAHPRSKLFEISFWFDMGSALTCTTGATDHYFSWDVNQKSHRISTDAFTQSCSGRAVDLQPLRSSKQPNFACAGCIDGASESSIGRPQWPASEVRPHPINAHPRSASHSVRSNPYPGNLVYVTRFCYESYLKKNCLR